MAVVHYKFKNSVDYDSLKFDGLAISLRDLKQGILHKKRMKADDTDLQVVNAQTGEVYSSPSIMIPKNTSLIIARIPVGGSRKPESLTPQTKAKKWAAFRKETQAAIMEAETGIPPADKVKQSSDIANVQSSEMEKIAQMIKQSTKDFEPSNYKYKVPMGTPSPSYVCYKCGKGGHYIQNCPNEPTDSDATNSPSEFSRMKKPSGIPMEHMLIMNQALPGSYKTHGGQFAVPKIDAEAYAKGKVERPPFLPDVEKKQIMLKKPIPKELKCPLCGDMAKDAVVIPCCGISYCDECIRNKLLETDDHICPSCDSMDVSPNGLIPNQMLRRAVTNFQNETGYTQKAVALRNAQEKVVQAAKAAAAAGPVLQKQTIVPRGPSVLDFKPPPKPASPPPQQQPPASTVAPGIQPVPTTPKNSYVPASVGQEPPTPTMDEPVNALPYPAQPVGSVHNSIQPNQGTTVPTLVNITTQPVLQPPIRPVASTGQNYYKPQLANTSVPPPILPYPPQTAFPPPIIPYGAPPPIIPGAPVPVVPPVFPPAVPLRPVVPPPVALPKPLSEQEFLEEKKRLLIEEHKIPDPLIEFAKQLEKPREKKKSRSRSWTPRSRSRSKSRPRLRSRSRSRGRRAYSRSPRRSYTPRRSLSPRRSYSPRRYSPRRSRSPYSPRRYRSPRRSWTPRRSTSRGRFRSYSRSPGRRRSFSRSRSRSRRRTPLRRSYSKSPTRRSPFRRSTSRGRFSPRPLRRSPGFRRSRSPRGRSPPRQNFSTRARSPVRTNYASPPRRRSPVGRPQDKLLRKANTPPPARDNKKKREPTKRDKKSQHADSKSKHSNDISSRLTKLAGVDQSKTSDKEQPVKEQPIVHTTSYARGNNNIVLVNLVDSTTDEESKKLDNIKKDEQSKTIQDNENKVDKTQEKSEKSKDENKENKTGDKKKKPAEVKKEKSKTDNSEKSKMGNSEDNKDETKEKPEVKEKQTSESAEKVENKDKIEGKEKIDSKDKGRSSASAKPRKRRSPTRKKARSKSRSESPQRVQKPLVLQQDRGGYRGNREGGFQRDKPGFPRDQAGSYPRDNWADRDNRGNYGRDWPRGGDFRGRGRGADYRGLGPDYRGGPPPPHGDFRGPPGPDYRAGPPPPAHPDFRGYPNYQDPHGPHRTYPGPAYPGPFTPNHPPPFPPRDPRDDPNYQGLNRDEDIVKFEQYKQMYDLYNRTYGFAPAQGAGPGGQTPPQGPPPAPPGTMPLPSPGDRAGSPSRRRSPSPRRHRSRSPGRGQKDRRDYDRDVRYKDYRDQDRRKDTRKDDRKDDRSPRDAHSPDKERNRERSPERERKRERDVSASPERSQESDSEKDARESSPEKKRKTSPDKKKDKKLKKRKEKAEGSEKKKKKKKDKTKSKKEKTEKKARKSKKVDESSDNEEVENVKKNKTKAESQNESESSESEAEKSTLKNTNNRTKRQDSTAQSTAQSESESAQEASPNISKVQADKIIKTQVSEEPEEKQTEQETVVSSSTVKEETVKSSKTETTSDSEVSQSDAIAETEKKPERRRSIKRLQTEPDDVPVETKKAKLDVKPLIKSETKQEQKEKQEIEQMEVSGDISPSRSEEMDEIPAPDDELMLDLPEISKWEKDDDPYDLSPEPMRIKEKWRPEQKTFLPRSVIEKAEHALAQKVMKPTLVSSAVTVIQSVKKDMKSPEIMDTEPAVKKRERSPIVVKKREKSPVDGKRRVFMESEKKATERRVATAKQHNVKITVSSTGSEKRKVATEGDLRDKLRAKQKDTVSERSRDSDRVRERDRERDREKDDERAVRVEKKRRDSHHKDRRESRDYDRQDSHKTVKRTISRKESVIDDSKFEPDYEDESLSEDNSEDSSSDSSSEEEVVRKKHKHKKNKHKKEKKAKKKKDKKKKKHKAEKSGNRKRD